LASNYEHPEDVLMRTRGNLAVMVATLVLCAIATAAPPTDSTNSPTAMPKKAKASPQDLIFNRKLSSTSISLSEDVVDVGSGKVAIDSPLTFVCPKGGCTITAEMHVQMGFNTKTGNLFALCAELDGSDMPPVGCPVVISLPTDDSFVAQSFAFAQSGVTAGTHTVQGFLSTTFGATRANYIITYRLYTP